MRPEKPTARGDSLLGYAPRVSTVVRYQRFIIAFGFLLFLGVALRLGLPPVVSKWRQLSEQRYCMNFQSPPGTAAAALAHWRAYANTFRVMGGMQVAFMGQRATPDGRTRLVVLDVSAISSQGFLPFISHSVAPATWLSSPHDTANVATYPDQRRDFLLHPTLGAADPSNPSHFCFSMMDAKGHAKVIDGWLKDDDTIELEARARVAPSSNKSH